MYELDHMLNGAGSRRHLQDMIRQTQHNKLAHDVEEAQGKGRTISPVHALLIALFNFVMK